MKLIKEFKPALLFLGKFLAIYLVGNILYGLWIESYGDRPDALTRLVAVHSTAVVNATGYECTYHDVPEAPKVAMTGGDYEVLHVFEGCNGVNVMIVFVAFLFAFGGPARALWIFLSAGLLIIHFFNLVRLSLLYHLAINDSSQFYYYHKYFFTAILYLVVFALWALWVIRFNEKRNIGKTTA